MIHVTCANGHEISPSDYLGYLEDDETEVYRCSKCNQIVIVYWCCYDPNHKEWKNHLSKKLMS